MKSDFTELIRCLYNSPQAFISQQFSIVGGFEPRYWFESRVLVWRMVPAGVALRCRASHGPFRGFHMRHANPAIVRPANPSPASRRGLPASPTSCLTPSMLTSGFRPASGTPRAESAIPCWSSSMVELLAGGERKISWGIQPDRPTLAFLAGQYHRRTHPRPVRPLPPCAML